MKIGDKVICINVNGILKGSSLEYKKIYTMCYIDQAALIINLKEIPGNFYLYRFITLKQDRKLKLQKLNEC